MHFNLVTLTFIRNGKKELQRALYQFPAEIQLEQYFAESSKDFMERIYGFCDAYTKFN